MGITELSSPLPPTKDYRKQRTQRAKGVNVPTRPAALKVQIGWKMIEVFDKSTDVDFEFQKAMVDKLLSSCAGNFVDCVTKSLRMKLELNSLEITEVNTFILLLSNALDNIMEYTNESLNCNGLIPVSHVEFCCFLGTLLLSSAFNASAKKTWEMMDVVTGGKSITCERFVQVLNNLSGYSVQHRMIEDARSSWTDVILI
jgi:hypothetical protein